MAAQQAEGRVKCEAKCVTSAPGRVKCVFELIRSGEMRCGVIRSGRVKCDASRVSELSEADPKPGE